MRIELGLNSKWHTSGCSLALLLAKHFCSGDVSKPCTCKSRNASKKPWQPSTLLPLWSSPCSAFSPSYPVQQGWSIMCNRCTDCRTATAPFCGSWGPRLLAQAGKIGGQLVLGRLRADVSHKVAQQGERSDDGRLAHVLHSKPACEKKGITQTLGIPMHGS